MHQGIHEEEWNVKYHIYFHTEETTFSFLVITVGPKEDQDNTHELLVPQIIYYFLCFLQNVFRQLWSGLLYQVKVYKLRDYSMQYCLLWLCYTSARWRALGHIILRKRKKLLTSSSLSPFLTVPVEPHIATWFCLLLASQANHQFKWQFGRLEEDMTVGGKEWRLGLKSTLKIFLIAWHTVYHRSKQCILHILANVFKSCEPQANSN